MSAAEGRAVFESAARAFADLVREIPDSTWSGPGLGEWDLRSLIGHTSRSLVTVHEYLKSPADQEDIADAAGYYVHVRAASASLDPAQIVERGRQAGQALGADPVSTIDTLVEQALADIDAAGDPLITVIGGVGIRLSSYLPTRIFELAVHGLDIAEAARVEFTPPSDVLTAATVLAAQIAVAFGDGPTVLRSLTGRAALPPRYSVV
ncbi:maleylpyruvate isomerase N-terminal domain-containing protein [Mycobacterium sp. ACS4331]|uniref:maleylpyruvate isomerase family mycothiol-dependent enzyme n=1 Tax=Mycobacterium sp. ACS4331 TaxID=1834121 RepID=UPI0008005200|nr:maleylpyruvate isomerase N-terminal domain-containing protein [Mycobacterium sp. ACS4331]OBF29620.1 mycothiol maleylpyruvate isomerase [Mycobacterium sp. ACS4331]